MKGIDRKLAVLVASLGVVALGVRFAEAQFAAPTCVPPNCNPSVIQNIAPAGTAQTADINIIGTAKATTYVGSGTGLTSLPAGQLTGTVLDARLSGNVPLKNAANVFTANNTFSGMTSLGSAALALTAAQNLLYGNIDTASTGSLLLLQNESIDKFKVDAGGTLTVGLVPWTRITTFPAACLAGQFVTAIGGTLTCSAASFAEADTLQTVTNRGNATTKVIAVGGAPVVASTGVNAIASNTGVFGETTGTVVGAVGVFGKSSSVGPGVEGTSNSGNGVYGISTSGIGGNFSGSTGVAGTGTTYGGQFSGTVGILTSGATALQAIGNVVVAGVSNFGQADFVVGAAQNLLYGNVDTTSSGNLLLLQNESVDKFKVSAAGNLTVAGTGAFTGNLTVAGQSVCRQNGVNCPLPSGIAGTVNRVPKFLTASTVGDSLMSDNGTTVTVGGGVLPGTDNTYDLGSSAARWKTLHVGPGSVVVHNDASNTLKATLGFSGTTAQLVTDAATPLKLTTGANAGLNVATNGSVGVANAAPAYPLDVTGDVRVTGTIGAGGTAPSASYGIDAGATSAGGHFTNTANPSVYSYVAYNTGATTSAYGMYSTSSDSSHASNYGGRFNGWYGTNTNYGVYAYGYGGATSYGVYALASGATTNWSLYAAAGDAYVRDNLMVGTSTTCNGARLCVTGDSSDWYSAGSFSGNYSYWGLGVSGGSDGGIHVSGGNGYGIYAETNGTAVYGVSYGVAPSSAGYFTNSPIVSRVAYETSSYNYGFYTNASIAALSESGFGTTTPTGMVDIIGNYSSSTYPVLRVERNSNGTLVSFVNSGSGAEQGKITMNGGTIYYNGFTGTHYAWTGGAAIGRGKLVTLSGANTPYDPANPGAEIVYGVIETAKANDPAVLGALGEGEGWDERASRKTPAAVMAVGNGDLWVVDGGDDVSAGDYLISSDIKGHAMKDPKTYAVSHVMARAGEDVRWSEVTASADGRKHKKISVFFVNFDSRNDPVSALEIKDGAAIVSAKDREQDARIEALEKEIRGLKDALRAR